VGKAPAQIGGATLPKVPMGHSEITVSRLALGSWRTLEHLSRDEGTALLAHAFASGITFFDDARYDDETGRAPIPTGWSEVLFGELFRAAGIPREEVAISNKLWWELWPEQSAVEELEASLERMRFERIELLYATPLPDDLAVEAGIEAIAAVIATGRVRAWGVLNWSAEALGEAIRLAPRLGIEPPAAVQLPYNLMFRSWAENPAMEAALEQSGAALAPATPLAGGVLSGKYLSAEEGRMAGRLDRPRVRAANEAAAALAILAMRLETTPAALAIAFTLAHPLTASTLFGARNPAQLDANVAAVGLLARMSATDLAELRAVGGANPAS
jgi:L-glyceraldehyde 3-phosphate reductase